MGTSPRSAVWLNNYSIPIILPLSEDNLLLKAVLFCYSPFIGSELFVTLYTLRFLSFSCCPSEV